MKGQLTEDEKIFRKFRLIFIKRISVPCYNDFMEFVRHSFVCTKCKKLFLFIIFLFFGGFSLFASETEEFAARHRQVPPPPQQFEPHHFPNGEMNYGGRKMKRRQFPFFVIGIKNEKAGDDFSFSVYFNDMIDTNSVLAQNIFVNEKPLLPNTEFLFNKNRRMLRFSIKKDFAGTERFSLRIKDIRSFDGRIIFPAELPQIEADSFFKYIPTENAWQKFL